MLNLDSSYVVFILPIYLFEHLNIFKIKGKGKRGKEERWVYQYQILCKSKRETDKRPLAIGIKKLLVWREKLERKKWV